MQLAPSGPLARPGLFTQLYLALWALQMAANGLDSSVAVIELPSNWRSSHVQAVMCALPGRKHGASAGAVQTAIDAMNELLGTEEDLDKLHASWRRDGVLWGSSGASIGGDAQTDTQESEDGTSEAGGSDVPRDQIAVAHGKVQQHSHAQAAAMEVIDLEDDIDGSDAAPGGRDAAAATRRSKVLSDDD